MVEVLASLNDMWTVKLKSSSILKCLYDNQIQSRNTMDQISPFTTHGQWSQLMIIDVTFLLAAEVNLFVSLRCLLIETIIIIDDSLMFYYWLMR